MEKAEAGTVRSVERALAIVELLGQHRELGLEELHYLTGLPKATVSRMLATLLEQGWVFRGLSDRRYRLRADCLFGDHNLRAQRRLAERAAPWLVQLSERTGLVADLSSFDGECLEVVESAIPPVLKHRYPHTSQIVGLQASLFHSAMGKACLGELDDAQVERLASRAGTDAPQRLCEQVRETGFGRRTEGHWEYSVRLPFLIRAVALPVHANGRVVGGLALHWPQDQEQVDAHLDSHLAHLAEAVGQVQAALARQPA